MCISIVSGHTIDLSRGSRRRTQLLMSTTHAPLLIRLSLFYFMLTFKDHITVPRFIYTLLNATYFV